MAGEKLNWQELTRLTQGEAMVVERVRIERSGIAIDGAFTLPPLARLKLEDQIFVMAFVRSHGSIKEMERIFGISYPTVKNRLNKISEGFVMVSEGTEADPSRVLDRLEKGEITAAQAAELLKR
jgi:hypothetical protein